MISAGVQRALLFVGTLVGYVLLAQDVPYGDGLILLAAFGGWDGPPLNHLLYLPLVEAWHELLAPLGCSVFDSMTWASGLGAALGVALLHRAAQGSGLPATECTLVAALVATAPAVLFYATVIEVPGVALAFTGLATWSMARSASCPGLLRGALVGVATALAASVHATGHLLPLLHAGLLMARRGATAPPWRGVAKPWLLAVGVHAACAWAVASWRRPGGGFEALFVQAGFVVRDPGFGWGAAPRVIWNEWVAAFALLSLVWLAGFRRRRTRRSARALAALLPLYLLPTLLLLRGVDERGAYLLPLAYPAAWSVVGVWRRHVVAVFLLLNLTIAVVQVWRHDRAEVGVPNRAVVTELTGGRRVAVVGASLAEVTPYLRADHENEVVALAAHRLLAPYPTLCALYDRVVTDARRTDAELLLTERFVVQLREAAARHEPVLRFVREHVRLDERFRRRTAAGTAVYVLEP
ncbi:MAG: hypothetical protein AAF628_13460 [Planctomycetota bacterium]